MKIVDATLMFISHEKGTYMNIMNSEKNGIGNGL